MYPAIILCSFEPSVQKIKSRQEGRQEGRVRVTRDRSARPYALNGSWCRSKTLFSLMEAYKYKDSMGRVRLCSLPHQRTACSFRPSRISYDHL